MPAINQFWQIQPNSGHAASQRTEVFVGFTDRALHIGVVAYDDQPLNIVSTDSRRDASLEDTDSFRVLIDGLLDRQNGYVFGTSPAGIEYDGQVSREAQGQSISGGEGGFNLNWDAPWEVRAMVSDFGWSAEMQIPFTSLRFGSEPVQTWGINFERRIRRNNEVAFWAPLSQDRNLFRVSEAGSIEGIEVPVQRNLQLTPYVLGRTRRGGDLDETRSDEEFGFDLKYSITPSLTLDATYNTDFAQVEVDEQQVNLDRFNLFFPEKRAFFLENSGQFTVGNPQEVELFFSRRIGIEAGTPVPIEGGLRLSGKIGQRTNVGLLRMSSEGLDGFAPANDYTVARVNQELPNRSAVGALFVGRDGDGSTFGNGFADENRTYAIDGRWGIGNNGLIQAWAAQTDTPGLDGRDDAFSVSGEYNDADWTYGLGYTEVGESFNPEVGFLARSNFKKIDGRIFRRVRPNGWGNLFEIRPHVVYRGYWDFEGFQETGFLHLDAHWEYRSGREFHTGVNFTQEGLREEFQIVPGVTIAPGTYEHEELQLVYQGDGSAPLNVSLRSVVGGRFGGDRVTLEPTVRYRIRDRFTSEFAYVYNSFDLPVENGKFTADLWRMRLSYSFTPRVLLQMLMQYNEQADRVSTNLRFSWLQSANAGLYLVYNEVDERGLGAPPRGREFVIKYSRIFDVLR
ncbi:MAG: carbohydrate binding family 9 domain-containing protein [Gammaproteobacteria bacterium]|nr:carbohydrate binding family 9 domain-containing protein [Gammaproteobacteria bacterium]